MLQLILYSLSADFDNMYEIILDKKQLKEFPHKVKEIDITHLKIYQIH